MTKAYFKLSEEYKIGVLLYEDVDDEEDEESLYKDKDRNIGDFTIQFDFTNINKPTFHLCFGAYYEAVRGGFMGGMRRYNGNSNGDFKQIIKSFLDKYPKFEKFYNKYRMDIRSINLEEPPTSDEAKNIVTHFLDSVFSHIELTDQGKLNLEKYCQSKGLDYKLSTLNNASSPMSSP